MRAPHSRRVGFRSVGAHFLSTSALWSLLSWLHAWEHHGDLLPADPEGFLLGSRQFRLGSCQMHPVCVPLSQACPLAGRALHSSWWRELLTSGGMGSWVLQWGWMVGVHVSWACRGAWQPCDLAGSSCLPTHRLVLGTSGAEAQRLWPSQDPAWDWGCRERREARARQGKVGNLQKGGAMCGLATRAAFLASSILER